MSGIACIYHRDDRPVDPTDIGRMVKTLANRGPDGAGVWSKGPVGLAHRMLWTTPESFKEKLPLVNQSEGIILTADARIDNRNELFTALNLDGRPGREISDSELILAAYEKWGENCPEKLLGDFAFVIWDDRRKLLFCARDHFGVKPFYYYLSSKLFACASEIKALLSLRQVPCQVNRAKVGLYLCPPNNYTPWSPDTFYQEILSLHQAHSITVRTTEVQLKPYWAPSLEPAVKLNSDAEYVEAFYERFTEAIRCRLRSAFPVCSTLSGGLDSSSVTCIARQILSQQSKTKLHTVYANCGIPSADETTFVDAVLSQGGLEHHIAKVSGPITVAHLVTGYLDQPVYIPTPAMIWAAMYKMHENGVRVLLTGHDGDTIVSHGYEYLSELALAGEWAILKQMLLARVQAEGIDPSDPDPPAIGQDIQTRLINDYLLLHLKDLARECMVKDLAQSLYSIFRYLRSLPPRVALHFLRDLYFNSYYKLRYRPKHIWSQKNPCLNTHFAEHIFLDRLIRNDMAYTDAYLPTALAYHHLGLVSDNLQLGTDEAGHMAAALAIEPRHPFLDKRLVELCLAVPAHLKFDEGRGRGVMRQAMKNILPEQVRIRTTKVCFFGFIVREMQTTEKTLLEDLLFGGTLELADYLDINTLRQHYQDFLNPSLPWATQRWLARILLRTAHLVMWLRSIPRRLSRGI